MTLLSSCQPVISWNKNSFLLLYQVGFGSDFFNHVLGCVSILQSSISSITYHTLNVTTFQIVLCKKRLIALYFYHCCVTSKRSCVIFSHAATAPSHGNTVAVLLCSGQVLFHYQKLYAWNTLQNSALKISNLINLVPSLFVSVSINIYLVEFGSSHSTGRKYIFFSLRTIIKCFNKIN